jgi:hypothetical protein
MNLYDRVRQISVPWPGGHGPRDYLLFFRDIANSINNYLLHPTPLGDGEDDPSYQGRPSGASAGRGAEVGPSPAFRGRSRCSLIARTRWLSCCRGRRTIPFVRFAAARRVIALATFRSSDPACRAPCALSSSPQERHGNRLRVRVATLPMSCGGPRTRRCGRGFQPGEGEGARSGMGRCGRARRTGRASVPRR